MSKEVKMSLKVDESIKTEKVYINTNYQLARFMNRHWQTFFSTEKCIEIEYVYDNLLDL